MKFDTISIVIDNKNEIDSVRKALNAFKKSHPNSKLGKPKFGELSGKILITFKVESEYSSDIILSFAQNYVHVLATTDKIKKKIDIATAKYAEILARNSKGWSDMKIEQPEMSISELESFAEEGRYEEIIRISNDLIHYGEKIVSKAKSIINESIENAIEKAFEKGSKNSQLAEEAIFKLIKVAGDSRLRVLNKTDMMKKAGEKAIELILKFPEYLLGLVDLANNPDVHNYINTLAFIKFGEKTREDEKHYEKDIQEAARLFNLRWLEIAFDVAQNLLSEDEKKAFHDNMNYFRNKKRNEQN
jgi:hypothetical protein